MKISIAKETAPGEKRVLVLPKEVEKIIQEGHEVAVEKNAGKELYVYDREYVDSGALIITDRQELFERADMLVKLKAPTPPEFKLLKDNILFSMFHHAQNPEHIYYLGKQGVVAVEIESLANSAGERLVDATDITGKVGILYAVQHLGKIPEEARALVLGYGRVGSGAINMCNRLGIQTKILRREEYPHIEHFLRGKDLLINAISWQEEEKTNRRYVVTEEMLDLLNPGAVVLDLAVDFPNPIQTCRPTDLSNPYYLERGKVHIGIYGYPGLVPISSAQRYSKQVLPLILEIANNNGLEGIVKKGDLGMAISKAIVNPKEHRWEKLEPPEVRRSLIE